MVTATKKDPDDVTVPGQVTRAGRMAWPIVVGVVCFAASLWAFAAGAGRSSANLENRVQSVEKHNAEQDHRADAQELFMRTHAERAAAGQADTRERLARIEGLLQQRASNP